MICAAQPCGHSPQARFALPRWTEQSPAWQTIDQELPEDHLARQVVRALSRLNLQPLWASYALGGSDGLRPDLMLRIVLIEVWSGRHTPNQWFRDTRENVALQWAGMGLRPSRSSWYNFRDRLGAQLDVWFGQVLQIAQQAELTPAKRGALDGSFTAAQASRHRLLNEQRLTRRIAELAAQCAQDALGLAGQELPGWMAKKPQTRLQQRERYTRARQRMDEFQAANQRQPSASRRSPEKLVVSPTEPEAAVGWDKQDVFRPLYNVQLVRDLDSPLTLAWEVFAQNTDGGTLSPMFVRLRGAGVTLELLLSDTGYVTGHNLALCDREKITLYGPWQNHDDQQAQDQPKMIPKRDFTWVAEENLYRCPAGHPLKWIGQEKRTQADGQVNVNHRYRCSPEHCQSCPQQARCAKNASRGRSLRRSEHEDLIVAHRARMETPAAKAIYRLRRQTVELGFADLKGNRNLRTLSGRGLVRARIHVGLVELTRNLLFVESRLRERENPSADQASPSPAPC